MRVILVAAAVFLATLLVACGDDTGSAGDSSSQPALEPAADGDAGSGESVLTGELPLLTGEPQDLGEYRGDVVLVVNTASECGFSPQFEQLQSLYEERKADGFVILGFPADDVAGQEPRDDEAIAEFCEANFGVDFPMFAKSDVLGESANPLYQRLAAAAGEPEWNFNKYLLDRKGRVTERFDVGVEPDDPALTARIDELI